MYSVTSQLELNISLTRAI